MSTRILFALFALVDAVCPAFAQSGSPTFDPAALLGDGKNQITSFIVAVAPAVIGLVILTAGFKKVISYVRRMFKSA